MADIYVQNHEAVFNGAFNAALLDYDTESKYNKAVRILERISAEYIYQNRSVQTLELQGYSIVNGLFDHYKPLLEVSGEDFAKLLRNEPIECFISMRLVRRLSPKQIVAYKNDVEKLDKADDASYAILEWYYRVRLVTDYISGMTDDFALHEYKTLTAL
ncbi:MAG: hypothetical protein P8Y65_04195 [Campylobacterales bacterium]